jgi:hypothetical protein
MRVMSLEELAAEKKGSRRAHPMMEAMAVSGFDLRKSPRISTGGEFDWCDG